MDTSIEDTVPMQCQEVSHSHCIHFVITVLKKIKMNHHTVLQPVGSEYGYVWSDNTLLQYSTSHLQPGNYIVCVWLPLLVKAKFVGVYKGPNFLYWIWRGEVHKLYYFIRKAWLLSPDTHFLFYAAD